MELFVYCLLGFISLVLLAIVVYFAYAAFKEDIEDRRRDKEYRDKHGQ